MEVVQNKKIMIKTKKDYKEYLYLDQKARGLVTNWKTPIKDIIAPDYPWLFQKKLRKLEYYLNCRKDLVGRLYCLYLKVRFKRLSVKLGYSIRPNVFGPGLAIVHYGTIVVNGAVKVGKNCRLQVCTNIGASGGNKKAPVIGDNVYIGPGAKIYGDIKIGNNIAIAANSSVNKSFLEENIMIAGSPARKIKDIDISKVIKMAK